MNINNPTNCILLTIDVEDWFQVENFKHCIPSSSWPSYELRVEKNTHTILNLLDSNNGPPTTDHEHGEKPRATFFVLGWVAEHLPNLVREIYGRGHEIASHGYYHNLCNHQSPDALKKDLADSKKLLEDITGVAVYGYRAPSFSVNADILKIIEACGYLYDSSFNSFTMHSRYGDVDLSNHRKNGIAFKILDSFHELPISNLKLGKQVLPWGGGGYFRLIPSSLFNLGVKSILKKEKDYLFYFHPWEIDPGQPRLRKASEFFKFRHYVNLDKTISKLSSFIKSFKKYNFVTCHEYLEIENPIAQQPKRPYKPKRPMPRTRQ